MRPFFIGLSISLGFSINPLMMAQWAGRKLQERIHNFDFTKEDIEEFITELSTHGEITRDQAEDALNRLQGLSHHEIQEMTMKAMQNVEEVEKEGSSFFQMNFDSVTEDDFHSDHNLNRNKKYHH